MKGKSSLALSILLILSLLLSACSGGGEEASGNSSEPKEGGSLIYARGADAIGLDPINVTDGESIRVTSNIFETLFVYDENLEVQPGLAESYKVSDDGMTWTITLKRALSSRMEQILMQMQSCLISTDGWIPKTPTIKGIFHTIRSYMGALKAIQTIKSSM